MDAGSPDMPRSPVGETFRFREVIYAVADIKRYRAICEQEHVFAATTRLPTDDEWTIILGMITGTIMARKLLMVLHKPGSSPTPCLQCARLGHQAAQCPTPEAEWNSTTLVITADEVNSYIQPQKPWKSLDDVKAIFTVLGGPAGGEEHSTIAEGETNDTTGLSSVPPSSLGTPDIKEGPAARTAANEAEVPGPTQPTGQAPNVTTRIENKGSAQPQTRVSRAGPAGWITLKKKKRTSRRPQQHHPETEDGSKPANTTARIGTWERSKVGHRGPKGKQEGQESKKRFQELITLSSDSEDESDDDNVQEEHRDARATSTPQQENVPRRNSTPEPETTSLERAIKYARMEKIRIELQTTIDGMYTEPDLKAIRTAIASARPHIMQRTSKAWTLEALNGRLTDTPGTGNCQYYAAIEALAQRDLKLEQNDREFISSTILLKYGLCLAHQASPPADHRNLHAAAIIAVPPDEAWDAPSKTVLTKVATFYKDLARSSSEQANRLQESLWGNYETLRMLAKLTARPVFLVSERQDPTNVHHMIFKTHQTKLGEDCVAFEQPGIADWLAAVDTECAQGQTPLILVYANNHYNGVIFDRHRPANAQPVMKKYKETILKDLWQETSIDRLIEARKSKAHPHNGTDHSKQEVLASDVKLTTDDMIGFLAGDGWTNEEKMEIIDLLVAEQTNFRERLITTVTCKDSEHTLTPTASPTKASPSEYEPSDSDSEAVPSQPSQPYALTQKGEATYRQWADEVWTAVQDEWLNQRNEKLPDLTDGDGIMRWISHRPEELLEAASWCENPFALFDHVRDGGVKTWMEPYWVAHCVQHLRPVVSQVEDQAARTALEAWVQSVHEAPSSSVGKDLLRNAQARSMLKAHAPDALKGATAIPLLTYGFHEICANVILLDRVFPDLARHILERSKWQGDTSTADLTVAYTQIPEFKMLMERATGAGSWTPIEEYMRQLQSTSAASVADRS